MAIPLCILYPVWGIVLSVGLAVWWSLYATYNIFKNCSVFTYLLVPVVWVLLQVLTLVGALLYCYIYVLCYTSITIYIGLCKFKNTPVTRPFDRTSDVNYSHTQY